MIGSPDQGGVDMDAAVLASELDKASFAGTMAQRSHADYDRLRRVWNAVADRRPAAIVRARSVGDVTSVVRIAAEHAALLAVRCGGHSLPGLSTCDDGVVLDLSLMNETTVDPIAHTVEVAGGALLGHLDVAGARAGLVTPAGVVSHTGVGGLALGGGMGWLSRRFGLTVDNLLSAEIVTADGRLIQTSADIEPDLFWAIRGGGGNFGVVTKFEFRMHPLGPVAVGRWVYASSVSATVLRGYRELAAGAPRELTTSFTLTAAGLTLTAIWSGRADGAEKALNPYRRVARPLSGSLDFVAFVDLQRRSDEHFSWGRRYYAKGGYLDDIDDTAISCLTSSIARSPTPDSELYVLQLGGAIADVDEGATAYSGRAAGFYWIAEPVWDNEADDERCISWGRLAGGRLAEISLRGNYVNEQADHGREVAVGAYGAEKYARLAKLKARYDPANLFRLNQNIEPQP